MLIPIEESAEYTKYFSHAMTAVAGRVLVMTEEQQRRFFKMVKDNPDIMLHMFPGMELFQYVAGTNPNPVDTPILQAYKAWAEGA
jgi:hypothetical protein